MSNKLRPREDKWLVQVILYMRDLDWNPAPGFRAWQATPCTPCFFQCPPPTPHPHPHSGWKPRSDSSMAGFAMRNPEWMVQDAKWLDNVIIRCFRTPGRCIDRSVTCYKQISEWESQIPRALPPRQGPADLGPHSGHATIKRGQQRWFWEHSQLHYLGDLGSVSELQVLKFAYKAIHRTAPFISHSC